ncbi:MAG: DNA-methyltransferase [Acidimicrobiales bacterium]
MKTALITDDRSWAELAPIGYCRRPPAGIGEPTPPVEIPRNSILLGGATEQLRTLPPATIDCVVTSPPYYMLRNYFTENQFGLESSVGDWVERLREVMAEVARVLKPAGSLWLNLGDSYSRGDKYGAPPKGMLCAPERMLLALAEDGWLVRNKVIWAKPNPMPTSVVDRLNTTYEVVYFVVRNAHYFYDLDAIREPHRSKGARSASPPIGKAPPWAGPLAGSQDGLRRAREAGQPGHLLGKNPGDVWSIPTRGFRGAHFATFPEQLVYRPIQATCPEAVCTSCGKPWPRQVTTTRIPVSGPTKQAPPDDLSAFRLKNFRNTLREIGDLIPCGCQAPTRPGVVLDPFFGSGTVGVVAEALGRDWIGIELNPDYAGLARTRIEAAREGVMHNKGRSAA